jgi:hypothetical protein
MLPPPFSTWYICNYITHCALSNTTKEYSNVYLWSHGLSRATSSQLIENIHHHHYIFLSYLSTVISVLEFSLLQDSGPLIKSTGGTDLEEAEIKTKGKVMHFSRITPQDVGTYICTAMNVVGEVVERVKFEVKCKYPLSSNLLLFCRFVCSVSGCFTA